MILVRKNLQACARRWGPRPRRGRSSSSTADARTTPIWRNRPYIYALAAGASISIIGYETWQHGWPIPTARQPPLPSRYQYEALEQSDAIRLLVLQPGTGDDPVSVRLVPACLSASPRFEAISYVWGNPDETTPILCSGGMINITHNLRAALQRFRLPDAERVLWADAICINQTDIGEKNTQVPLMKDIYSRASAVLVWLGSDSPKLQRALDALGQLHIYFSRHLKHYNDDTNYRLRLLQAATGVVDAPIQPVSLTDSEEIRKLDWNAISDLLSLPWFGRVWTLQEIVNAKEAVLVCGARTAPFDKFLRPLVELFTQYVNNNRMTELGLDIDFPTDAVWSVVETGKLRALRASNSDKVTLYQLVKRHNLRQCTNPRDKIYGFLGLTSHQTAVDQPFMPQYDLSVETVYKDFALWTIASTRSLDIFSSIRDYRVHSKLNALPSWVPDWMDWGGRKDIQLRESSTYAGGKNYTPRVRLAPDNDNILLVRGYVVDRIERLALSYYQMTIWDDYRHVNYVKQLKAGVTGATREEMIAQFKSQDLPEHYLDGLLQADEMVQKYSIPGKTSSAVMRDIVWIENCKDIATRGAGPMSRAQYDAFWRTIVGDHVDKDIPAPRSFKWTFQKHLKLLSDLREGKRSLDYGTAPYQVGAFVERFPIHRAGPRPELHDDEFQRWDAVRETWTRNRRRRFCATEKGRLGWAPETAQEGDLICIFYGAKVPYILRPCGDANYILLGGGYLHGMMHGEGLKMKDMKEEELRIC